LCIDEGLEVRNGGGFRKGLEELVRILEFQVVREGEEVPALVEKGPEIGTIAPANIVQDLLVQLIGDGPRLEKEGEILVEQEPGQIGVLGFEGEFVARLPALKEGEPGGPNGDVNVLVQFILFVLFIGAPGLFAQESLVDFAEVAELVERVGNGRLVEGVEGGLGGHSDGTDEAVFEELLHDPALHDVANEKEGGVLLEVPFGLEIVEEFLEAALLALREAVHLVEQNGPAVGGGRVDEFADAGFCQKGQNGLAEGTAGAGVARIELLEPVALLLADAIGHGRLADAGTSDEKEGRVGASLEPLPHRVLHLGMETAGDLFGLTGPHSLLVVLSV